MENNPQSVMEIKAAMEAWAQALSRKDLDAMHHDYADQYIACLM